VIETVRKIFEAFGKHDLKTVAEYVADDCTGFAGDHKLLVGKEAILADMKMHIEERAEKKVSPLLSYTIERPYAQVTGDTAVVTFVAYKTYGGDHPHRKCSHTTNIFVKRDGRWQQSHYRNDWKEVSLVSDSLTATGDPIPGRELEKSATEPTR
jgi:uncharacterized protein (TIGR02246 family)